MATITTVLIAVLAISMLWGLIALLCGSSKPKSTPRNIGAQNKSMRFTGKRFDGR
jgi:hypothetical protein